MEPVVDRALADFTSAAKGAFADHLRSVTLFGSAAEDRLRSTSDINIALVLSTYEPSRAERLREALGLAWASIRLRAMFVLESELPQAASAFAVKFADIRRRHRVLHGSDPFAMLEVPRAAEIAQLRQSTLHLVMQLREQYVDQGLHEERLSHAIAEAAGPMRACAPGCSTSRDGRLPRHERR